MRDDNYMNPNDKARWGFSGTAKDVKVGTETVGETGGVDHVRVEPEDEGARGNGAGETRESVAKKSAKKSA